MPQSYKHLLRAKRPENYPFVVVMLVTLAVGRRGILSPSKAVQYPVSPPFIPLLMVPTSTSDASAPRDPQLSAANLHLALDELDAKIKTLHNRAHATAAGSANTYEAHAAALEAKRARLAAQLTQAGTPPPGSESGTWQQLRQDIETLGHDVQGLL